MAATNHYDVVIKKIVFHGVILVMGKEYAQRRADERVSCHKF
jgi:hypothetical protein